MPAPRRTHSGYDALPINVDTPAAQQLTLTAAGLVVVLVAAEARMLPFKVPLDSRYNDQIPMQYRFSPAMVVEWAKDNDVRPGVPAGGWYDRGLLMCAVSRSGLMATRSDQAGLGDRPDQGQQGSVRLRRVLHDKAQMSINNAPMLD